MSENRGKRNRLPLSLEPMVVSDRHRQMLEQSQGQIPPVAPSADKQKRGIFSEFLKSRKQEKSSLRFSEASAPLPEIGKTYQYSSKLPVSQTFTAKSTNAAEFKTVIEQTSAKSKRDLTQTKAEPLINYRKAVEPKVMLPFETRLDQTPRKIDIERKKRQYSSRDIKVLIEQALAELKQQGLLSEKSHHSTVANDKIEALPVDEANLPSNEAVDQGKSLQRSEISHFLPLEAFDDTEYDCRTVEDWLDMASTAKNSSKKGITKRGYEYIRFAQVPLPAKAFDGLEWRDCLVIAYDELENQWKVKWRSYNGWEVDKKIDSVSKFVHPEDENLIEEIENYDGNPRDIIDGKEIWVHR